MSGEGWVQRERAESLRWRPRNQRGEPSMDPGGSRAQAVRAAPVAGGPPRWQPVCRWEVEESECLGGQQDRPEGLLGEEPTCAQADPQRDEAAPTPTPSGRRGSRPGEPVEDSSGWICFSHHSPESGWPSPHSQACNGDPGRRSHFPPGHWLAGGLGAWGLGLGLAATREPAVWRLRSGCLVCIIDSGLHLRRSLRTPRKPHPQWS